MHPQLYLQFRRQFQGHPEESPERGPHREGPPHRPGRQGRDAQAHNPGKGGRRAPGREGREDRARAGRILLHGQRGGLLRKIGQGRPPFRPQPALCGVPGEGPFLSAGIQGYNQRADYGREPSRLLAARNRQRDNSAERFPPFPPCDTGSRRGRQSGRIKHIERYSKLNLVQKSIINFTAFHLTSRETKEFVELFKSLDENSDGVLSIDEIKKGVEQSKFGAKGDNIVKMFEEMDIDKNGLINYTEFISALMDYEKIKENQLLECFNSYDTDDSGKISFKEFCDMIKPETEEEKQDLKDLYDQFDTDGDGEISLKEFKEGFKKRN